MFIFIACKTKFNLPCASSVGYLVGVGVWVGRGVEVGRGIRVCVEVGVRVLVEVDEAGMSVDDAAIVGDAAKATDAAVGSVGLGLVQLAIPNTVNNNVRLGPTSRKRL